VWIRGGRRRWGLACSSYKMCIACASFPLQLPLSSFFQFTFSIHSLFVLSIR
jgi:hypothetical protein